MAEATINAKGATIHASSTCDDMYAAIDSMVGKLDRQVIKHKEKLTNHHRNDVSLKTLSINEINLTASDKNEDRPGSKTDQASDDSDNENSASGSEARISDFLQAERIQLGLDIGSRKRLFEAIAELAGNGLEEVSDEEIFKTLTERERLVVLAWVAALLCRMGG